MKPKINSSQIHDILLKKPYNRFRNWQYKNTFFLIISIAILIYFADSDFIKNIVNAIGNFGYIGAFITGIFFVSTFTVAPAMLVLYNLADKLNPIEVALLAGLGAVFGDYIIFRFMKDKVFRELIPVWDKVKGSWLVKIFYTPYFSWLIPFAGAVIIASPFPDELGISLMGLSKIKNWHFLLITFLLNAIGIFLVVTIAKSF